MAVVEKLIGGFDSPEGPAFDARGRLHWVNWLSSSILRLEAPGRATEILNTGGIPAGLAFHRDGTLYIADEGDDLHGVLRVEADGRVATVVSEFEGRPLNGANDLVFDSRGVLYFSDPWRSSLENPIGGFYRSFPDGRLEQIDAGLAFPNGVAISADDRAVYLAETWHNRILRYDVRDDGSVGPRQVFAVLRGVSGPDGMAFDATGDLHVAHFGAGTVDVLDPSGTVVEEIRVPGRRVTNCAFGGDDLRTLVITDVETRSLYTTRRDIPGQRLFGGLHHY